MRAICLALLLISSIISNAHNNECVILNYDTHIAFNGKRVNENISYEFQINNASGTKYAEVVIPFSSTNEVKNLEAAIYDLSGNEIRKLKKKDIVTRTPWDNGNFHTDDRLLTFKLIHTSYPYILKYKYTRISNNYISLARWTPIFNSKLDVKMAELTVDVPHELKIRLLQHKIDSAVISHHEDIKRYTWSVINCKPVKEESFSPSKYELNPYVVVMPETFHYGVNGKSTTWKEFGNWECRLIDGLDKLTEEEKLKVKQLTDTIPQDIEKVKALYHYLQDNTRYINVSLDIGGLLPHPASYVCTNRYGDCKALTNYMKAMLKEIGINSIYSTIYAGIKPIRVLKSFPLQHANHVILSIPLANDTIWLECTDKTAPFNYLGASTQNRFVLINEQDKSKLVASPKHKLKEAIESYTTSIQVADQVTFSSTGLLRGRKYDYFKGFDTGLSTLDKKEYIDNISFSHKADIQDFDITRPHRDSTFLYIHLSGDANQLAEKLGSKILLNPFKAIGYTLTPKEERESDIFVYYPVNKCDTLIYNFNQNITHISGLSNEEISSEFGVYKRSYKTDGHQLIISRQFTLTQDYYSMFKYAEFYDFVNHACNLDQQKTIITF